LVGKIEKGKKTEGEKKKEGGEKNPTRKTST